MTKLAPVALFLACVASGPNVSAQDAQDAQESSPKETAKSKKPPKHPSVKIGALKLDFTARIESDMRMAAPAIGREQADLEWQDRRIGVEGTAFKRIDFELSRELGQDFEARRGLSEKTPWRDAYVNTKLTRAFNIEAGRFKLPFGHEALTGETNLDFIYRSLAARVLSPGRDVGVMTHGRAFGRKLEYQAGYFTRDGDNARTSQTLGGQDALVARLALTPFAGTSARALVPLEIGAAVSTSRLDNRLGLRGRTVIGDGIFFDRLYVNGRRERVGLEAAWAMGPVGFSSEYITTSDERKGMGFDGEDLPGVDASAWYVSGTWALTGERKRGRLEPHHDLLRGGIGAIELAARVETLRFAAIASAPTPFGWPALSTLPGNSDRVVTFGVNWYLNHYVKLQGNVVIESIDDPQRSPAPTAGGRFVSPVVRVQFRL